MHIRKIPNGLRFLSLHTKYDFYHNLISYNETYALKSDNRTLGIPSINASKRSYGFLSSMVIIDQVICPCKVI